MTTQDISLVKLSLPILSPVDDQVAALFYARLFELDPSLRNLFHGDREIEGRQFMEIIAGAVRSLDRIDAIADSVRQLGARHYSCGVRNEHYTTMGTAFLWALEKVLGAGFTPDLKYAWTATYALLANKMMEGARSAAAAA